MGRVKQRDPIPADFPTVAAAAEFWDTHDLSEYEEQTREVEAEVDLRRRTFLTALEPELARKVSAYAEAQGVSVETLINVWLTEKLTAASVGK